MTTMAVKVIDPEQCRANRKCLVGAVPLCRPSRTVIVQEVVGIGVEVLVLPINSAVTWLSPLVSATPGHLIAVVSHWPEFVETARTLLLAAGVSADALMLIDANDPEWIRGLRTASAILCDVYTASRPELPKKPKRFVFPLLAEATKEMLRPFAQAAARDAGVVAPSKAS